MKNRKQLVLENKIRKMVREELNEANSDAEKAAERYWQSLKTIMNKRSYRTYDLASDYNSPKIQKLLGDLLRELFRNTPN